jgi:DNA-damage-inducible protein D
VTDIDLFSDSGSPFDAIRQVRADGTEFWSARDLMPLMGYASWRNFETPINRAMKTAENQGMDVPALFAGSRKLAGERPQGGGNTAQNYELARYAAYLVAMNGDPNIPEVAAAQHYFAIRTREAETAPARPALTGKELLAAALMEAQQTLQAREARIHQLESHVAESASKVTYVDTYVTDTDLLSFSTVASTHNVTEKWLRELLIKRDWIYVQSDSRWSEKLGKKVIRNRYSEKADKKRYFRRVENHEAPRFRGSEVMHTLKITPQGAEAIARLIAKEIAA